MNLVDALGLLPLAAQALWNHEGSASAKMGSSRPALRLGSITRAQTVQQSAQPG